MQDILFGHNPRAAVEIQAVLQATAVFSDHYCIHPPQLLLEIKLIVEFLITFLSLMYCETGLYQCRLPLGVTFEPIQIRFSNHNLCCIRSVNNLGRRVNNITLVKGCQTYVSKAKFSFVIFPFESISYLSYSSKWEKLQLVKSRIEHRLDDPLPLIRIYHQLLILCG